jgi:hypothetical protein
MKYLIMLAMAAVFSSCTNDSSVVVVTQKLPGDNPPVSGDPTPPKDPPSQPLNGRFTGQMVGKLLDDSTYKIEVNLKENTDGTFTNTGAGLESYYRLWDLNKAPRQNNIPHEDGYATGSRDGSVVNLSLRLNYKPCFVNMKAYVSSDTKTLSFFGTKQTVKCSIVTLNIVIKPFTMTAP